LSFIASILLVRFSMKFLFEFKRKKANFVADFSQIQGKNPIVFINLFNASGNILFYLLK